MLVFMARGMSLFLERLEVLISIGLTVIATIYHRFGEFR